MSNDYNKWLKSKDFNSNVEGILRKIDEALNGFSEDTRRGKGRISFGEIKPKTSLVILFWESNSVKLQVKAKNYPDNINHGFGRPGDKRHFNKGFMELRITDAVQFDEELKNYLIKGL